MKAFITFLLGFGFGSVLIGTKAFHWFRIQEMFHFDSFYMFGLLFSAILTGIISILILKRLKSKSIYGNEISPKQKVKQIKPNLIGGFIFGSGWALTGACTAPVLILLGGSWKIGVIVLLGAVCGAIGFALTKFKLPD